LSTDQLIKKELPSPLLTQNC